MDPQVINTGASEPGQVVAPEGHDAAMAAKVDETNASLENVGKDAPQGEKILGKFDTIEDLQKAYQELEGKLGQPKPQETQTPPAELTEDNANELVEAAGLDMDALSTHYEETGQLSDDHYAALEKAGVPRAYVDQYIAGIEAQASQMRDSLMEEVGGQEAFGQMAAWAAANLSEADLTAYNDAVDSGDMTAVRSAVMSLAYRYQRDAGRDPKLVNGNGGGNGGPSYGSLAQLTAAMKDPRYDTDPAYRDEVQQTLARSNIF